VSYNTPEYRKQWYYKNKNNAKKTMQKYYIKNKETIKEKQKEYILKNPHIIKSIKKKWRDSNKERTRFYCFMRRKRVKQATPKWCNKEEMLSIVKEAQKVNLEIDHIIPLNHPLVCGLHVPANIQLLTRKENRSKKNKFDIIGEI